MIVPHRYALATAHGIAAYDAAYVALAEALGATLWTGDRRLCAAVLPLRAQVAWIGDYE